jgi:hypothetical protein
MTFIGSALIVSPFVVLIPASLRFLPSCFSVRKNESRFPGRGGEITGDVCRVERKERYGPSSKATQQKDKASHFPVGSQNGRPEPSCIATEDPIEPFFQKDVYRPSPTTR